MRNGDIVQLELSLVTTGGKHIGLPFTIQIGECTQDLANVGIIVAETDKELTIMRSFSVAFKPVLEVMAKKAVSRKGAFATAEVQNA